jgi:hypothetical protein
MIAIPELVTQIDARAFQGCWQLQDMHVPSNVTNIVKAVFMYCRSLAWVKFDGTVLQISKGMFGGCATLHSINTSHATIVTEMCNGCIENHVSLQKIVLPPRQEIIGANTFKRCKTLANITINKGVRYIGDLCFEGYLGMHSINLCNGIEHMGCYIFLMCLSLTAIVIPGSVTIVRPGYFSQCSQLKEVTFNKGSKIKKIDCSTFEDCTSLKTCKAWLRKLLTCWRHVAMTAKHILLKCPHPGGTKLIQTQFFVSEFADIHQIFL